MTTDLGNKLGELVAQAREAAAVLSAEDSDLRPIAFERVLEHLLGSGDPRSASPAQASQQVGPEAESIDAILGSEQQRIDATARYFAVKPEHVRELFDLSGDEPKLMLSARKLSRSKAAAVREITLLICGVRTAVGLDTGSQNIREAADDLGKLDSNNFVKTLDKMDEIAVLGKRGSHNRGVRMRAIGAEAARPLAQKLVA